MANKFIQWNCRGLRPNFDELNLLIQTHNPIAVCLQETFLKDTDSISMRGFNLYHKFHNSERASGGVSILVNENIPQSVVALNTKLQAVAVRVTAHKAITICSIYLPPRNNFNFNPRDLQDLFDQLPTPFVVMGDFNGHHTMWGCEDVNIRGKQLEDLILKNGVILLNDKTSTYFHPGSGSLTSIDLTLCSPSLLLDFSWKVGPDPCGSDHFPIILENDGPPSLERVQRWKLAKADWGQFQHLCSTRLHQTAIDDADDPMSLFTSILKDIADETVPKTSAVPKRFNKPWFNDTCKNVIKERNRVLERFKREPTKDNLNSYRIARAKARREIRQSKRSSWRNYVSKLNSQTSVKSVWNRIRKIKGKESNNTIRHLSVNDANVTSHRDIANTLADNFSYNSSTAFCTDAFLSVKNKAEKKPIKFDSGNAEVYNKIFSVEELRDALRRSHDTAVGPDDIHYQLLKHLPESSLLVLLEIFNKIWVSGDFPSDWRKAIIIPISKPGKDPTNPSSYRPIALTSCICKTMERMINRRLVWYLESHKLLANVQCGFRSKRSTVDHLVRFETFVREAFIHKQHLVSVFFDMEKAYDTTWKYGILKDLHGMGLRGRLPGFINQFLNDRSFKVRVGSTFSDSHPQEMGVPQGSILSVTLFSVKINSITQCLTPGVDSCLYVDDFQICYRSANMSIIERQLQLCLNKLQQWATDNGFRFSKTKTVCMHICQKRGFHLDPQLMLDNNPIPVVEETKFLGVIFDRQLSFIPHLKYVKKKGLKALNILKVIGHTDWGADRKVMLRLYRSLVRSKLDYGCIVYGSARKSYLQMLDPIHNQGLRLCLGAFRTSPVESLYVDANEPSLGARRTKLSLQYASKLKSLPTHPTHNVVFDNKYMKLFDAKPNAIRTFGLRIRQFLDGSDINLDTIMETPSYFVLPPWCIKPPDIVFDLVHLGKDRTDALVYKQHFMEIRHKYRDFIHIYTDGSRDGNAVASATVLPSDTISMRLPDSASIFTAEIQAIINALVSIKDMDASKFIIFTDSLSCLQALHSMKLEHPLIGMVIRKCVFLSIANKHVVFCWVPSHVGIAGNEKADSAAKFALNLPRVIMGIPYTDFKYHINKRVVYNWQNDWNNAGANKLHPVKPVLGDWQSSYRRCRKDEIVLCRSRIGHTYLTHSFIFNKEEPPVCDHCQCILTVRHILVDCPHFQPVRDNIFGNVGVVESFRFHPQLVLKFLKEIGLYHKF